MTRKRRRCGTAPGSRHTESRPPPPPPPRATPRRARAKFPPGSRSTATVRSGHRDGGTGGRGWGVRWAGRSGGLTSRRSLGHMGEQRVPPTQLTLGWLSSNKVFMRSAATAGRGPCHTTRTHNAVTAYTHTHKQTYMYPHPPTLPPTPPWGTWSVVCVHAARQLGEAERMTGSLVGLPAETKRQQDDKFQYEPWTRQAKRWRCNLPGPITSLKTSRNGYT